MDAKQIWCKIYYSYWSHKQQNFTISCLDFKTYLTLLAAQSSISKMNYAPKHKLILCAYMLKAACHFLLYNVLDISSLLTVQLLISDKGSKLLPTSFHFHVCVMFNLILKSMHVNLSDSNQNHSWCKRLQPIKVSQVKWFHAKNITHDTVFRNMSINGQHPKLKIRNIFLHMLEKTADENIAVK